jgi:Zn-dependent protease with chaperone function
MHLTVLLVILGLAWGLRATWTDRSQLDWLGRWQLALLSFLLPPLLLATTSISIIWMGPHGRMVWVGNDWLSYSVAIGCLGFAILYLVKLTVTGGQMLRQVRTYPTTKIGEKTVRVLNLSTAYIAQIGFWQPELVITKSLLDSLSAEHLAAVLAHEQAHYHYRDTFCFFWLGWIRQITTWLPQTEAIWQELLVLRELRADRWASQQTDPLLVAEALLLVIQSNSGFTENFCIAFSQFAPVDRLTQRIEALLAIAEPTSHLTSQLDRSINHWNWSCLLVGFSPLLAIAFHQ